jgi:hypothetical protein
VALRQRLPERRQGLWTEPAAFRVIAQTRRMPDYNARIELETRDFDESAVDFLMDAIAEYHGVVAGAVYGDRLELIVTVAADSIRQAVITALSTVLATGHEVYALEVLPADEFDRRIDTEAARARRAQPAEVVSYP